MLGIVVWTIEDIIGVTLASIIVLFFIFVLILAGIDELKKKWYNRKK